MRTTIQNGETMIERLEVRESVQSDAASIENLYAAAFPDEELRPVVRKLLREGPTVLSLVGIVDKAVAGHATFTTCSISGKSEKVSLLAPLAVAPAWQGQGVGSEIVAAGLQRLKDAGFTQLYVLGDPAYYGRFGFVPDDVIAPPYPLPEAWREAWQSISLSGAKPPSQGKLCVPEPWRDPALWAP